MKKFNIPTKDKPEIKDESKSYRGSRRQPYYKVNVTRLQEVYDKAVLHGFKHCPPNVILGEAKSIRHLRKLIGEYQSMSFNERKKHKAGST